MNLFAVTYAMPNELRMILVESEYLSDENLIANLHPAISSKLVSVEFVRCM